MDLHGVHGRVIVHADLDCFYCQVSTNIPLRDEGSQQLQHVFQCFLETTTVPLLHSSVVYSRGYAAREEVPYPTALATYTELFDPTGLVGGAAVASAGIDITRCMLKRLRRLVFRLSPLG